MKVKDSIISRTAIYRAAEWAKTAYDLKTLVTTDEPYPWNIQNNSRT